MHEEKRVLSVRLAEADKISLFSSSFPLEAARILLARRRTHSGIGMIGVAQSKGRRHTANMKGR